MIKYVQSDVFKASQEVLIHGCNCLHIMGAGVAFYVKKLYPEAYINDKLTIKGDKSKLGTYSYAGPIPHYFLKQDITIINAYTQFSPGFNPLEENYIAIQNVMEKIKNDFKGYSKAMPKIGAGLAGGDWNEISEIINKVFPNEVIFVYSL